MLELKRFKAFFLNFQSFLLIKICLQTLTKFYLKSTKLHKLTYKKNVLQMFFYRKTITLQKNNKNVMNNVLRVLDCT